MILLSKQQILLMHEALIERYGGIHGVRDEGLLDSAINAPFQSYGGVEFYPGLPEKAARLGYGLIQNHPFYDGNKRIGALAMLALLDINGVVLNTDSAELTTVILHVADGTMDGPALLAWIKSRITAGDAG